MRAIDADTLELDTDYYDGEYWAYSKRQIDDAPTIEMPEIIHCKDCKRYVITNPRSEYGFCKEHDSGVFAPDDFCSCAKRKRTKEEIDGFNQ